MKRLVLSLATAVSLTLGGVLLVAGSASAAARTDDTATVCQKIADVNTQYKPQLQAAGQQAQEAFQSGDTAGADAAALTFGKAEAAAGAQLQQVAANASDPAVKAAVVTWATDLQQEGQGVTNWTTLAAAAHDTKVTQDVVQVLKSCPQLTTASPSASPTD
jgi:hypothetical protein